MTTTISASTPAHPESTTVVDRIVDLLADPQDILRRHPQPGWWRQSLAGGALGITLLHVELARTGRQPWNRARSWLRFVGSGPIDDGPGSNLHYGAPALAFVLARAAAPHPGAAPGGTSPRGAQALATLDSRIARATRARLDHAHRRIDTGRAPALAEFDLLRGLTGLGAYWLARHPAHPAAADITAAINRYLVRLTEPLDPACVDAPPGCAPLPGWWTPLAPSGRPSPAFPHGHVNHGMAHGIAGPLALLALTATAGIRVPDAAIDRILTQLNRHRRRDDAGTWWWPYWTTPPSAEGQPSQAPGRPSWCYGGPGLARAHHLAGIARDDPDLHTLGHTALSAFADHHDLRARLGDDASVCHGHAGLLHLCATASAASTSDDLYGAAVDATEKRLLNAHPRLGLLDGLAGTALALATHEGRIEPGWDRCLLIS